MKEKRTALCSRIRSAKSWLNRAEDNFDKQNDVQGEINLLLAQAELRHLQEKEQFRFARYRHLTAIFTAAFITLSAWGVWNFYFVPAKPVGSVKQNANYYLSVEQPPSLVTNNSYSLVNNLEEPAISIDTKISETFSAPQSVAAKQTVQENLSEREMRELIRTAGSVLRSKVQ